MNIITKIKLMNFDKRYWWFIGSAILFSTISSISTLYILLYYGGSECDPAAVWLFNTIGIIPSMIFGILIMTLLMIGLPYILKQNDHLGLIPTSIMLFIVLFTFFDATNNISVIFGINTTFNIAHSVVGNTINATGMEMLC